MTTALPPAPTPPDQTFGPNVLYAEGEFMGELFISGAVEIDAVGQLTVRIIDQAGAERYQVQRTPTE